MSNWILEFVCSFHFPAPIDESDHNPFFYNSSKQTIFNIPETILILSRTLIFYYLLNHLQKSFNSYILYVSASRMTSTCNADHVVVSGDKSSALKQLIKNAGTTPVYVFFFSPTCPHCITLNDEFQKYRSQCQAQKANATLIIINVKSSPELFQEYKVQSFPQVMVYRNRKRVKHIIGADLPALADAFRMANIQI